MTIKTTKHNADRLHKAAQKAGREYGNEIIELPVEDLKGNMRVAVYKRKVLAERVSTGRTVKMEHWETDDLEIVPGCDACYRSPGGHSCICQKCGRSLR